MERVKNNKSHKGFTLTEVMVVLAILVVVLAVGIPAAIWAVHAMSLKELDESARSIFLAAQNRMTAMVGSGEFGDFAKDVTDNADFAAHPPKDFPVAGGGTGYNVQANLRYLDSANAAHEAALAKLLPAGSIEGDLALDEHHYVVEYNCETGAVYAVWYSDKGFDYASIRDGERGFKDRLKVDPLVGYYGGSGVDYAAAGLMPIPQLTLINAEELLLRIELPAVPGFNIGDIKLEVTVKGNTSHAEVTFIDEDDGAYGMSQPALLDGGQTAELILDTLNPDAVTDYPASKTIESTIGWTYGMQFRAWKDLLEDKPGWATGNLIPGEDITVTVKTYYDGYAGPDNKVYMPGSASVTCNSLFAGVDGNTAKIAYGRHLQNLDAYTATGDKNGKIGPDTAPITAAEQIREIDFAAVNGKFGTLPAFTPGKDEDDVYYWTNTYGTVDSDGIASDVREFTSIYNSALTSYNGNSLPIRSLNARGNANRDVNRGGLFHSISGTSTTAAELKNIVLIDTQAKAFDTQGHYVGALAGSASDVTIENCQVYLDPEKTSALDNTVRVYASDVNRSHVGGLVGGLSGTSSITNSLASTVIQGNRDGHGSGGLVGEIAGGANVTIRNSYAACYIKGNFAAGGLVGSVLGTATLNIDSCYAAGIIESIEFYHISDNTYGLAGGLVSDAATPGNLTISNSYAAVRYGELVRNLSNNLRPALSGSGLQHTDKSHPVYGAAPAGAIMTNVYYISQTGVKYAAGSGTPKTTWQLSEMDITNLPGDWYHLPAETATTANPAYATVPYHQTTETSDLASPYPYPMLNAFGASAGTMPMLHYGDWLEDMGVSPAYYEKYANNYAPEYGIWGYLTDMPGTEPTSSLLAGSSGAVAAEDGYGLLVRQDKDGKSKCPGVITLDGVTLTPVGGGTVIPNVYSTNQGGRTIAYDLYPYTFASTGGQYYHSVYLFDGEYCFNTDYACEIVKLAPGTAIPTTPQAKPRAAGFASSITGDFNNQVVIRTARQLANMAKATGSSYENAATTDAERAAQNRSYVQLMDIDYSKYTGSGLTMGKTDSARQTPAALSGSGSYNGNEFIIKNLYITSGNENSKNYAGLFGCTNGTFKNIYLVNISVSGTEYVGALAGRFQGSATAVNCGVYVDTNVPDAYNTFKIVGTIERVGGLIGNVFSKADSPTTPKLDGCFAAVKVEGGNRVGGLVGSVSANQGDFLIKNCYSGGHTDGGAYIGTDANVTGNNQVGGLIGRIAGDTSSTPSNHTVTFEGVNYSTCSVKANVSRDPKVGQLIGECDSNVTVSASTGATVYALGEAFDDAGDPATTLHDESTYLTSYTSLQDILAMTASRATTAGTTDKYDATLGSTYPYLPAGAEHHGDWPELSEAVFYWEKEGANYHFLAEGFLNGERATINTLCTEHHTIEAAMGDNATSNDDWGYGLYGTNKPTAPKDSGGTEIATDSAKDGATAFAGLFFREGTAVTTLQGGTADKSCNTDSKADSTEKYYLNLGFGAAIELTDATDSTMGGESKPYQIRNVQQLDNIPDAGSNSSSCTARYFDQTHDLNGNPYTSYAAPQFFAGTYNGGSYRILDLAMPGGDGYKSGLFGVLEMDSTNTVQPVLENIILYSPSKKEIKNIGTHSHGGLALAVGDNSRTGVSATIRNCVVAGYTISGPSNLGGLVGVCNGSLTIENSAAVNKLVKSNTQDGVGGLVGLVRQASVTLEISNSYAGGSISGQAGSVGGIVGSSSGTATYSNVYSYVNMADSTATTFYGIGPNATTGYYLQNCFPRDKNATDAASQSKSYADLTGIFRDSTTSSGYTEGFGEADETHSYPTDSTLTGGYPFPAVVTAPDADSSTHYVHYGDWVTKDYTGDPASSGPEVFEPCTCTTRCTKDHVDETCPLCSQSWWYCGTENANPGVKNPYVNDRVNSYATLIRQYAEQYGVDQYVDLIQAIMMLESLGEGPDPMQATDCGLNELYPRTTYPDGIADPEYSINVGVQHLADCLERAGVTGPADMVHIPLALQGYNFGAGYITWAVDEYGGYSLENAEEYDAMMAEKFGYPQYGDKGYVPHVLFFYQYKPTLDQCICDSKCAEDTVNKYCLVCYENWERCTGEPEPECTCTSKCAEGAVNTECPVCAENWESCACAEAAPDSQCVCESKCAEGAVNTECPVCAENWESCACADAPATPEQSATPETSATPAPEVKCVCDSKCTSEEAKNEDCPVCSANWEDCECVTPANAAPEANGSGAAEPGPAAETESAGDGTSPVEPAALPPEPQPTGDDPGEPGPDPGEPEPDIGEPEPDTGAPEEGGTAE